MLGVIHTVERDSHNIVTVEFHDQSGHPSTHFDDYNKYTMGSLGAHGAAYASTSIEKISTLSFKSSEKWGGTQGDWSVEFPAGEHVTALATGGYLPINEDADGVSSTIHQSSSGHVVAASSRHFLRFFSSCGTQKYIMNFGEEIVTMTAGNDWLLVVHRPTEYVQSGNPFFRHVQPMLIPL